jgi:large subunit ribosomal protein L10
MTMKPEEKAIPEWKVEEVRTLQTMANEHKVIVVADLFKVRTQQLQELARKLGDQVKFRVAKNNLMKIALKETSKNKANLENLSKSLTGSSIFLFNDMNPFKLSLLLDKNKVKSAAKAGDVAQIDVTVPSGNTGLAPGPIIGEFTEVGLPTRIETGSVLIAKDTVVVKKGEAISMKLASVLSRLGVKPMEIGLKIIAAYDEGLTLNEDQLRIDLNAFQDELKAAVSGAFNLAFNSTYPTTETLPLLFGKAYLEALSLATNMDYATKETLPHLIRKANAQASYILGRIEAKKS